MMNANSLALSLLLWGQVAVAAPVNNTINEALYYYCQQDDEQYQERVLVGEGQQVMYHQGAFMQLKSAIENASELEQVRKSLVHVGIESDCAQYLMTHAVVDENSEWKHQLQAQVLFDFDQVNLNAYSRYVLAEVKARVERNSSDLIVVGNADSVGSEQYNLVLGLKRSQAVADYLDRNVEVSSHGEQQPISSNQTADGRHLNRRVELSLNPKR